MKKPENKSSASSQRIPRGLCSQDGASDSSHRGQTIVVLGGNGGMVDRYRDVVEGLGLNLRHYERRVPSSARHAASKIALVVVIVGMISHPLREQAVQIAKADKARIVYVRTPSVSALREAVSGLVSDPETEEV